MIKVKDLIGQRGTDYEVYYGENAPQKPAVSVLMPTYCRGDNGLLKRAILSVLNQTFQDFELIIVDDGSVDCSRMIIEQMMKEDSRIVYIRNQKNSGMPSVKVMQGFRFAKGDYIAYQFDDDQWYPDTLQTMYQAIRVESNDTFAYGACDYIKVLEDQKLILGDKKIDKNDIFRVNTVPNNTVIHHREMFERYGSYDPHLFLRRLTDWDLWKRWIDSGAKVKHIDKVLSIVEEQRVGSLYTTYDSDIALTRIIGSRSPRDRNARLTPACYEDYEIDDLSFVDDPEIRNLLYAKKIKPYYDAHPQLLQKIKNRQFILDDKKKTIMITKKNYRIDKDNKVTALLQQENPYFRSFYMQSEHLPLDASALEYADATLLIGEQIDFSYEAFQIIRQKPYLLLEEKEIPSPQEILRQLKERATTLQESILDTPKVAVIPNTETKSSKTQALPSSEELDQWMAKNLLIEEQQTTILKLQHQISELMGDSEGADEGEESGRFCDVSDLCDEYDRLRFDIRTKLIRHLTRADYEGNRLYRQIIEALGQQEYLHQGYYAGWSGFLSESGEELLYKITMPNPLPKSILLYPTNYNTTTKAIVADIQMIDNDNNLVMEIPLRGRQLKHKEISEISLETIHSTKIGKISLIRIKARKISRACGISFLEWKIRAINGKIRDKQLCLGFRQ